MDTNGLRFWMLSDRQHWNIQGGSGVQYDAHRRSLRLASQRLLPPLSESEEDDTRAEARDRLTRVPQTVDSYGTRAYWDDKNQRVMATGALPTSVPIFVSPTVGPVSDLAMGYDGVLYLAVGGRIVMQDRRGRWTQVALEVENFVAWRLAANPDGGAWVLDRTHRLLARVIGLPFPERPYAPYPPGTFRPHEENPDPPEFVIWSAAQWLDGEIPVAIASSPRGRVAVLNWRTEEEDANVRYLSEDNQWSSPVRLIGSRSPYSIAWVSEERVAVLSTSFETESSVYLVKDGIEATEPVGDFYPLRAHNGDPFVNGVSLPPHYPTISDTSPLYHLSLPSFAPQGHTSASLSLDSGSPQTVWHRLYLEAMIPANCGIKVFLATTDERVDPDDLGSAVSDTDWHEHQFGEMFASNGNLGIPQGAWVSLASEIPYHPGLTLCPREERHSGLFTVLIQRSNRPVRTLLGRFLQVRVTLQGDARATPELWALRAYGPRFSYLNNYLPELYRETLFGIEANAPGEIPLPSTPPDFLERFLDNFEGILTPLEDRISHSYLLTDPRTVSEDALDWLGSWIGLSFDTAYPQEQRRRLLKEAPKLYRQRGTLSGLRAALNVATNDAVDGGEIAILEDFRLRRTFATILGADFSDEQDPLLVGRVVSGNSYVGDTLFLGDEEKQEFLALFGASTLAETEREEVEEFYDHLAYQVTILVHQRVEPQDLGLIRRVVALETPAHIRSKVVTASHPLMVGIASLVGVDTYLSEDPGPQPVRVGQSQVGRRDLIQRPASLDPRLEGGRGNLLRSWTQRPVADPGNPVEVEFGGSFLLDGSASYTFGGRRITRYIWTRIS